ncbi:MAG: T9SS type A sorting domain-containing protein, partial [Bacteroidetes bacterium]|nr:T9SS type A sorting domain-containing protein [Bacteroidota bacterium]
YTDENGCSAQAYSEIEVKEVTPLINIPDTSICAGATLILDAETSGIISYSWWPGGQTTAAITIDTSGFGLGSHMFIARGVNQYQCTSADTVFITFKDCTAIDENLPFEVRQIFPNPSHGTINLLIYSTKTTPVKIRFVSIPGEEIRQINDEITKGESIKTYNIKDLSPGLYYILISAEKNQLLMRIIVQ